MKFLYLLLYVILSSLALPALGQAIATLPEKELLMGSTTKLDVEVTLPSDTSRVEFPLLKTAEVDKKKFISFVNDSIEMLVDHKKTLLTEGDRYAIRYELTIQAFDSGRYEIPSFEFIVAGQKVLSNPVEIDVIPVKVKADDKIDDFTGVALPFELNPNPEEMLEADSAVLIWWIIGVAVLLLLAITGYIFYRRNGRLFPSAKTLQPYEIALERLGKIETQKLPERGRTKEYYTRLTDVLRVYLKKQFNIRTSEKTSAEILSQIASNKEILNYEGILKSIFDTADFVKFAKVNPSVEENSRCMREAVKFVRDSHPKTTETEEKGGEL